jgi:hypothetical protein
MATEKGDTRIREELRAERQALSDAVGDLRREIGDAADISGKLKAKLPVVAAGAFGLGFLKAGGVGAAARFLMRRSREGDVKAKAGRFKLVDRK